MVWIFSDQWAHFRQLTWSCNFYYLFISFFFLIAVFFLDAFGWHLILRSLGQDIPAYLSIRIWMLSSLTRYLPGGIWPYASRTAFSRENGIKITVCSISLYLETILIISSSITVGVPFLINMNFSPLNPLIFPFIFIISTLMIHPKFILLFRFIPGKIGSLINSAELPTTKQLLALYFYYIFFWVCFGVTFVVFAHSFYSIPQESWLQVGSIIILSFCIGFVIVFVPGGIGIRESAIYLLSVQLLPPAHCILLSIGSRVWIMMGEIITLLLVLIIPYIIKRRENVI